MKVLNPNNLPVLPIADLLPTQGNLKDLTETNYKKLKSTIENRGFSYPVYIWENEDGLKYLLDGHQRQRVLTTEGWNEPIPYLKVPADNIQEAMARLLEITSQYATITQEGIDEFIAKYGLNEAEILNSTSFDAINNYEDENESIEENPYTGKIETPIYELSGEKPNLSELYNVEKTNNLIKEIKELNVPPPLKDFLISSANRMTIYNYANIAEYYAHSDPEVQQIMEKLALVIIDYDKAIELGFVRMTQEINESIPSE